LIFSTSSFIQKKLEINETHRIRKWIRGHIRKMSPKSYIHIGNTELIYLRLRVQNFLNLSISLIFSIYQNETKDDFRYFYKYNYGLGEEIELHNVG